MNVDHPEPSSSSPTSNKLKRKSMGAPQTDHEGEGDARPPHSKKLKTDARSKTNGAADPAGKSGKGGKTEKKSDGQENTVRCHQCTRQSEPAAVIECTYLRPTGQRCVLKYCKACMHNRYEKDIGTLKASGAANATTEGRSGHAGGLDYIYRCPRCSDSCNCRFCRKAKGLPAIGKAAKASTAPGNAPENGVDPVAASSAKASAGPPKKKVRATTKTTEAARPKPHASKPKPHVLIPPSPHIKKAKTGEQTGAVEPPKRRAGRPKREPVPKAISKPVWTHLPTPLTHDGALQRLNIREFLLRFGHLADIARGHLEELEELGSNVYGSSDADDDDATSLVGWISEPALKAILVGLLALLSKDPDSTDASAYTKAIQTIKSSGASLNKMWAALASLREKTSLALPDPLPPAASTQRHSTRSGLQAQDPSSSCVVVLSTSQLVPVVDELLEHALQTKAVRDDFERAVTQEKDLVRAARELTAEENARWKIVLDAKDISVADRKIARTAHKAALTDIEHAQRVAATECVPRFGPLGRDAEGRVYYTLTPGVVEREAAVNLLEGEKGDVRFGRRRGVADEAQRKRMRHWSWLLAVYGRKPEGAAVAKRVRDEDDEGGDDNATDGDEDAEGWWAFWEPEEVAKLSEWLAMKHGIDLEAKRASKEPEDAVAAVPPAATEGEGAGASAPDAVEAKRRARASAASSVEDASFAGPSRRGVRTFASLNNDSEDEDGGVGVGGGANSTDDEDADIQMHDAMYGVPAPTKRDLRVLAKGLKEYADLLDWRIRRASKESKEVKDGAEKADKADKGKAVQRTDAIPTQSFYGK
ncbi:uncharacterized protein TRAVEDRAFT_62998 [Trametes versicolor FP-101664 SS1]|uniref:uncharacterized protein n=1 Tax=Trametes versicolor (strain FP-101664) TaxID=717944 RepID=UPI00046237B6|nr:uncharacterized protein TRAVEDRAFT_62998 [Trametes versicolor FP-101664 SS1]EIW63569.1 hypothetical protein TRAVEDRAFT_62998 [Trametes versicolor FP-101664 SS1]